MHKAWTCPWSAYHLSEDYSGHFTIQCVMWNTHPHAPGYYFMMSYVIQYWCRNLILSSGRALLESIFPAELLIVCVCVCICIVSHSPTVGFPSLHFILYDHYIITISKWKGIPLFYIYTAHWKNRQLEECSEIVTSLSNTQTWRGKHKQKR